MSDNGNECENEFETQVVASTDAIVNAIKHAFSDNIAVLAMSGFVIGLALMVVYFCLLQIVNAAIKWWGTRGPASRQPEPRPGAQDDVLYGSDGGGDALGKAEGPSVAKRIARIKASYKAYNDAKIKYADRRRMVADDLMDERIISRTNDNYAYNRRRPDDLRFHNDDWVVVRRHRVG